MPMMQSALEEAFITRSTFLMSEESTCTHSTGAPIESVTIPFTFSWTLAPDAITADLLPVGNSMKSPSSPRIPSPMRIRRGNSIVWEPRSIDFWRRQPEDKSFLEATQRATLHRTRQQALLLNTGNPRRRPLLPLRTKSPRNPARDQKRHQAGLVNGKRACKG